MGPASLCRHLLLLPRFEAHSERPPWPGFFQTGNGDDDDDGDDDGHNDGYDDDQEALINDDDETQYKQPAWSPLFQTGGNKPGQPNKLNQKEENFQIQNIFSGWKISWHQCKSFPCRGRHNLSPGRKSSKKSSAVKKHHLPSPSKSLHWKELACKSS